MYRVTVTVILLELYRITVLQSSRVTSLQFVCRVDSVTEFQGYSVTALHCECRMDRVTVLQSFRAIALNVFVGWTVLQNGNCYSVYVGLTVLQSSRVTVLKHFIVSVGWTGLLCYRVLELQH